MRVSASRDLAVARQAVDLGFGASVTGHLTIAFFGGEPMLEIALMEDIAAYARGEAERRGASLGFSLSTNGTVLDERRIRFLREQAVHVQVSMDGVAEAQDRGRPFADHGGSFAAVADNLRVLAEQGSLHQLVAVMTPETLPWLVPSLRYLAGLGVPEIYFAPNYLGDWTPNACELLERQVRAMADAYADLFRDGVARRVDPLYSKMVTHLVRGTEPVRRCAFGVQELAISPAGHIYPCDRTVRDDRDASLRIGHVGSGIDARLVKAANRQRARLDGECRTCQLRPRCSAWCGCAQVETSGRLGQVSSTFCWMERLFIAEADRLAAMLFAERNPTFLRDVYRLEPVKPHPPLLRPTAPPGAGRPGRA